MWWSRRFRKAVVSFALSIAVLTPVVGAEPAAPPIHADVLGSTKIDATGRGTVQLKVRVTRADGVPFQTGTAVRAIITRGDARFSAGLSADLQTDVTGIVTLPLYPGTAAGTLTIRFSAADTTADVDYVLTANDRAPLVVGFATGGIGPVPGWVEAPDGAPNGNNARKGQISLYGTGEISKHTRGTFAYDSANTLDQSLGNDPFLDNPNNRPFPIYGDSSIRRDDALSTNHIFAAVQNGRSSAMFGEFYAQAAPSGAVGGYNTLVNGAKINAGGSVLGGGVFEARNNTAYARTVISPTGLAVASQTLHPDIVIGSDVLTLVHIDKRTGAILSSQMLARGSDYFIDYASGLLRFTNILLPYDDEFNPQAIVVQYQYGGSGAVTTMLGGKGGVALGKAASADAWYLNDSIGTGNLSLLGQSVAGHTEATTWSLSHEHTNGFLPINSAQYGSYGDAYKAYLDARGKLYHLTLDYNSTDAAYDNPFGTFATPGLVSFNAKLGLTLSRISELELFYLYAHNALPASSFSQAVQNADTQASIKLNVKPSKRVKYHVAFGTDAASSNGVVSPALLTSLDSTQSPQTPDTPAISNFLPAFTNTNYFAGEGHTFVADAGFDWRFAPHATIGVARTQPLGASVDPYDPPTTSAQFGLDVGAHGQAFIRQLWQQMPNQSFAASQTGSTYAATAQSQTMIGFSQLVGAATFETGYAVEHTVNGTNLFDAIGVRTKIVSSKRLNADGFFQMGDALYSSYGDGQKPFFMTVGTSLDYAINSFHTTGQVQIRTGFDSGSTFNLGATGPISPAVSLYGAYTGAFTTGMYDTEIRGGLAYRPSRNDRYVTLLTADIFKSNLTNYNAYVTNVVQLQELYRSSSRTEWAASAAYKITGDAFFAPRTTIWGLRGDQRIGGRFDIGSEVHFSDIAPIGGSNATGFAVEAGYRLGSTLRLAAGYNFSGFADPDTAINPTHRGVYVTLSTYIDRIFGWGKDNH
jgi:hypothetical protein